MTSNLTTRSRSCRGRLRVIRWLALLAGVHPAVASAQSRTETLLVLPATGAGVSSKIIQSARALLVERLVERDRRFLVLDMDRTPVPTPFDPQQAVRMAFDRDAREAILFDLRRSESTTVLKVSGFAVPDGERLFTFEESTAGGPDDLPAMIGRAVDNTVIYRPKPPVREPRTLFLGARANGLVPLNAPGKTDRLLPGAGVYLLKDGTRRFFDLGFDFVSQTNKIYALKFGLGGYATFWAEDDTPYLGLSACWKWSKLGGQGANGLVLTPALGVTWRRRAMISVRLEAGLFVDLFSEKSIERLTPQSAESHLGYGPQLSVGGWL
jgi:hypothetical protein